MNNQLEAGKVDTTGGDISGDAHTGAPIAHGLQRMGALFLAEFARERHDREAAIAEPRGHMVHRGAGAAEHQRRLRLEIAEHIDDRVFLLVVIDRQRAVFDVQMLFLLAAAAIRTASR